MNKRNHISDAVIKRLPKYYRYLSFLEQEGESKISSKALAEALNVTASQVRQDFSNFGEFGQQGYGYDIANLKTEIAGILGLHQNYNMIIIGAGNIGSALAHYTGFTKDGFFVRGVFDINTAKVDVPENIGIYHMGQLDSYVKANKVDIAIIATQKDVARSVFAQLEELGVKSIWNFAPVDLHSTDNTKVENINMSDSLFVLSYYMKNGN